MSAPEARAAELREELERTRSRGYGVDDQENELGVNCIAVPLPFSGPGGVTGAVSVSALAYRTPLSALERAVDEIRAIVRDTADTERRSTA